MGSCYSGLGSRHRPSPSQIPVEIAEQDLKNCVNKQENKSNIYSSSNCSNAFNNSFNNSTKSSLKNQSNLERLTYEEIAKQMSQMTSQQQLLQQQQQKRRIPILSGKSLGAQSRIAPTISKSQEFVDHNEIKVLKPANKLLSTSGQLKGFSLAESSTSTSISSATNSNSSINLSKNSSLKSSSLSSSANSILHSAIPKPKSRSPTPTSAAAFSKGNNKNNNVISSSYDNVNLTKSTSNERLKLTNNNVNNKNVNRNTSSTNPTKSILNIQTKTTSNQFGGLPKQTSKISNQLQGQSNLNLIDKRNNYQHQSIPIPTPRFQQQDNHIYSNTNTNLGLQGKIPEHQVKPTSYYYGMNKPSCPYKRPDNAASKLPSLLSGVKTNTLMSHQSIKYQSNLANQQRDSDDGNKQVSGIIQSFNRRFPTNRSVDVNDKSKEILSKDSLSNKNNLSSFSKNVDENLFMPRKLFQNQGDLTQSQTQAHESVIKENYQNSRIATPNLIKQAKIISKNNNTKEESLNGNSTESTPEHHSISSTGTGTDGDNRDFLIDDEISDQPELVLNATLDQADQTLKCSLSELEALKSKQRSDSVSSSLSSPTSVSTLASSSNSPSITITTTKLPTTTFRRPRPLSFVETPDGSCGLDSSSYRAACQDLLGIKTLLFRLHGLLQDVINNL